MLGWLRKRGNDPKRILKSALGDYELPTFPHVIMEAMRLLRDPESGLGQVGDVLVRDPRVTARLLQIANSPAYALRHPVRNVHHAVSLLGRSEVESLLLAVGVRSVAPAKEAPGYEPRRFWRHAARRATIAKALAEKLHPATKSECFTAALLGDMAVPLLATVQGDRYGRVLEIWRTGGDDLDDVERDEFGWDHAVVGASMCDAWGFPDELTAAIGSHHGDDDGVPLAVALVSLLRESDDAPDLEALAARVGPLGLGRVELSELVERCFAEADEVAAALAA